MKSRSQTTPQTFGQYKLYYTLQRIILLKHGDNLTDNIDHTSYRDHDITVTMESDQNTNGDNTAPQTFGQYKLYYTLQRIILLKHADDLTDNIDHTSYRDHDITVTMESDHSQMLNLVNNWTSPNFP